MSNSPSKHKLTASESAPDSNSASAASDESTAGDLGLGQTQQPLDGGISLDQLTSAFAEMLEQGDDPYGGGTAAEAASQEPAADANPDAARSLDEFEAVDAATDGGSSVSDGACELSPRTIFEAMLFVGHPENEPITSVTAASLMRGVRPSEIDELVEDLNHDYAANHCPYAIASEGAGYRLVMRDEYDATRQRFYGKIREARLSQIAVDVLALVAYHQPISAKQVGELRGAPSNGVLNQLVRRGLLRIERTEEDQRRQKVYHTDERFLELFGLSSLEDLPRSQDLATERMRNEA